MTTDHDHASEEDLSARGRGERLFPRLLALVLGAGFLLRLLYHSSQGASDPFADRPFLDGEAYVGWAKALLSGTAEEGEAYYLAPLYPHVLAALFAVVGEKLATVYLVQHVLSVASAGAVGWLARRRFGAAAGLAAAFLFVFHFPLVFFAATPMGETLALALLLASLVVLSDSAPRSAGGGFVAGLACLARPNLLLVPGFLVLGELRARRWRRAGLIAAGTALAILPVTARNWMASGHPVLVSANGGITLYHGNGPDANGVFTRPQGFSGVVADQRAEATTLARRRTGDASLDNVEADAWWGAEARRVRMHEPGRSLALLARRVHLLVDDYEHSLDYDPMLDTNPWRPRLRLGVDPTRPGSGFEVSIVPFALLFGLAAAALALFGPRRSGGWQVWGPILACAATPVVFYVSSRYRLATSALLTIPAGLGAAGLLGWHGALGATRRRVGLGVCLGAMALSFFVPSAGLRESGRSYGLSNRAGILTLAKDWAEAERYARMAVEIAPEATSGYHNLAYLLAETNRPTEALASYRRALACDASNVKSATALAILLAQSGRADEALPPLRRALSLRPSDRGGWSVLAQILAQSGRRPEAEAVLREAASHGVEIDPRVLEGR